MSLRAARDIEKTMWNVRVVDLRWCSHSIGEIAKHAADVPHMSLMKVVECV